MSDEDLPSAIDFYQSYRNFTIIPQLKKKTYEIRVTGHLFSNGVIMGTRDTTFKIKIFSTVCHKIKVYHLMVSDTHSPAFKLSSMIDPTTDRPV